jgi:hypothetical protein
VENYTNTNTKDDSVEDFVFTDGDYDDDECTKVPENVDEEVEEHTSKDVWGDEYALEQRIGSEAPQNGGTEEGNGEADLPKEELKEKSNISMESWSHPLKGSIDVISFEEFGRAKYQYVPILDPDGELSGCYMVFFKYTKPNETSWIIGNTLLSSQYNIVVTDKIVKELSKEIDLTESNVYVNPFMSCYTAKTGKNKISIFKEDIDKQVFELVTGISSSEMDNLSTDVEMYIINSYNGTRSVKIIYTLAFIDPNLSGKCCYRDFFSLENYKIKFVHKGGSVSQASSILENIEECCENSITILRNTKDRVVNMKLEEFATEVSKKFRKPEQDIFNTLWCSLPSDKSLLSLSTVASKVLSDNYDVDVHNKLSAFMGKYIRTIMKNKEIDV